MILKILLIISSLTAAATLFIAAGINTSEDSNMDAFFKKSKIMDKLMRVTAFSLIASMVLVLLILISMTTGLLNFIKMCSLPIGFLALSFYIGRKISDKIEEE